MIVTDYDLAFCKYALYCIYDKLIDQSDTEYYCNVYGKDALFLYAFCHWLFHLFLADLDYQNRTRIEEVHND